MLNLIFRSWCYFRSARPNRRILTRKIRLQNWATFSKSINFKSFIRTSYGKFHIRSRTAGIFLITLLFPFSHQSLPLLDHSKNKSPLLENAFPVLAMKSKRGWYVQQKSYITSTKIKPNLLVITGSRYNRYRDIYIRASTKTFNCGI